MTSTRRGLSSSEMIAALAACGMAAAENRRRRRQQRLGQAVHELRRPLQALLLTPEPAEERLTAIDLALAALHDLESVLELDRRPTAEAKEGPPQTWELLLQDSAERWRQAAWLRGGKIGVRCELDSGAALSGEVAVMLARALDNLIINSLTHGGATVTVMGRDLQAGVELTVTDRGAPPPHAPPPGRGPHGQGLKVVTGIAERLGGTFQFERAAGGSRAALLLPQPGGRP